MAEQEYDLMHKDDVCCVLAARRSVRRYKNDADGMVRQRHRLIIQLLSAPQRVLPQSILDQRIQADLLRHCANRSLLVQLR